jgi:hypothetical protein
MPINEVLSSATDFGIGAVAWQPDKINTTLSNHPAFIDLLPSFLGMKTFM